MFEPWIGKNWGKSGNAARGVRLLVLGESHYCSPENSHLVGACDPATTREVVEEYALEKRHKFFTGITQVVSGRPRCQLSTDELRSVWASIAFYNYVPVFVATEPRVRPTGEMFALGQEPFSRLLREHDPEAILVCGFNLWWWVLKGLPEGFSGNPAEKAYHPVGRTIAARMMHPSASFFSSTKWRPVLVELLDRAVARKAVADDWSADLKAQTRDVIKDRDLLVMRDGCLHLKHVTSAFGTIAEDDLSRGVLRVVERRTGAETTFASADELIAAGWALD